MGSNQAIPDIESQVNEGPSSPFDEKQKAKEESTVPGNLDQVKPPLLWMKLEQIRPIQGNKMSRK